MHHFVRNVVYDFAIKKLLIVKNDTRKSNTDIKKLQDQLYTRTHKNGTFLRIQIKKKGAFNLIILLAKIQPINLTIRETLLRMHGQNYFQTISEKTCISNSRTYEKLLTLYSKKLVNFYVTYKSNKSNILLLPGINRVQTMSTYT